MEGLVERGREAAVGLLLSCRPDRASDIAVDEDFDSIKRSKRGGCSRDADRFGSGLRPERVARLFAVELDLQQRSRRDEASSCEQTLAPLRERELTRHVDVDAAETERHRMDTGSRSGRRHHPEATVEIGVVRLEAEVDPTPLGEALVVQFEVHVLRGGVERPRAVSEFGLPTVVVRQLKQIDLHQRHDHRRPRPRMLFQVEERAVGMSLFGDPLHRRNALVEPRSLPADQDRAERVRLPADGEDFVLGVQRIDAVSPIDGDPLGLRSRCRDAVACRRVGVGRRDPVRQRRRHVDVFRED